MIQRINRLIKIGKYENHLSRPAIFAHVIPVIWLLAVILFLSACQSKAPADNGAASSNIPQLIYTKHARCRMDCRHINESEIKEILAEHNINNLKSNADAKPCPVYAYEGYSSQHQHLRIIIGQCDEKAWKVITCIDLGNEFQCDCH